MTIANKIIYLEKKEKSLMKYSKQEMSLINNKILF